MQSEMGSTRALACSDGRPAGRDEVVVQSLNGDSFERFIVVGEGANHSTRRSGCATRTTGFFRIREMNGPPITPLQKVTWSLVAGMGGTVLLLGIALVF